MADLAGKVCWVTGSSRGIGQAIAQRLSADGATVIVHGSTPDSSDVFGEGASLAEVAANITRTTGVAAGWVAGDLTHLDSALALADQIKQRYGPVDILVAAAGGDIGSVGVRAPHAGKIQSGNDALNLPEAETRAIWERNFLTAVHACQAAVPAMVERRGGCVVTIGSIAGLTGLTGSVVYASAKAAVHEYTRCLAAQLRPYGIPVNAVAPGDILTERFKASRALDPVRSQALGLERYGQAAEIAAVVSFLCSPAASYVSGQIIRADGGLQLWSA